MREFETLYHKSKSGKVYSWRVWVDGETIYSDTGQLDGKRVQSSKIATPKNEGRSNATTAEEQALKEAQAMWIHKLDRKYSLSVEDAVEIIEPKPMLAHKLLDRMGKFEFPVEVSAKLDGCRSVCLMEDGQVVLKSRGGKYWTLMQHIIDELSPFMDEDMVIDGELYIDPEILSFQDLMSAIKKQRANTPLVEYWVYDIISLSKKEGWLERKANLEKFFQEHTFDKIKMLSTETAHNMEEVQEFHDKYAQMGYEGLMARLDAPYEFGMRSFSLLKYKEFIDEEMEIVDFTDGIGKFTGCIVFKCKTPEGKLFNVVPKTTEKDKKAMFLKGSSYIGKFITVIFQRYSDEGVPIFPVARFRGD